MAAALRATGSGYLKKCLVNGNSSMIRHSVTASTTTIRVGSWLLSSSYHTGTSSSQRNKWMHCGGSSKLFLKGLNVGPLALQVSRSSVRHNSSASSILHKIFFVNAASPYSNEEIIESNSIGVDTVSQDTSTTIHSAPDATLGHTVFDDATTHSMSDVAGEAFASSHTSFDSITYIPPPPVPPEAIGPALNALGEPTFQSLGLGGWSPIGIFQNCLEFLHVSADLPWWGAIALTTVVIRTLLFPLVILAQRNAAKMNNYMPQLQILQMKMTEARNYGNQLAAARYGQEIVQFMKEKDMNPLKNVIVPLAQAPIFISVFIGLRRLANLPLESFKTGGLFWFSDLTVCDPYYLLPIITSITMLATIELGTDSAKLSAQNMQVMKYFLRGLPLLILPFTINFPAAVLCYWVSTNMFSLIQVGFLKIPSVRQYFNIEQMVTHKKETLPQQKKGPIEGFKESWKNMQISREIAERQGYDEIRFKKAGAGPIIRTYKHDPTKRVINVQAKMKNK